MILDSKCVLNATLHEKKNLMIFVEDGETDFVQDHFECMGTTAMRFHGGRERWGSTQNTGWAGGNL